ncbi:MAG: Rrf2 family transcriptional regulator [Blastocatellia bacterium]|nr:Rrf2 family transcriptional regulator [Blastocatellia bacterium]
MRLTFHADYSLRVLLYLASHPDRLVSTVEISQAYNISRNHLVRVVNNLGKKGFIEVHPGRSGGIKLGRQPEEIILGEVIRATEPDFYLVECFDKRTNSCPITPACGLKSILKEAVDSFLQTLNRYTLRDISQNHSELALLLALPKRKQRIKTKA